MNNNLRKFTRNFTYSFTVKIISMLISVFVILMLPKWLGLTHYSYFQLYMFYLSYTGFLGMGWTDGIYLKTGGEEYTNLNRSALISQFWLLALFESIIFFIIITYIFVSISDSDRMFIFIMTSISGFFLIIRAYFYYILESTNRIKEFALINLIDRSFYFLLTVSLILFGINSYKPYIFVDMFSKATSVILLGFMYRELVFGKTIPLKFAVQEAVSYIRIGSKLMLANIVSTLIIGIIRWGIEFKWDVETFGKVSLTLSISNLLMLFVNSVGTVMFPMLRRTAPEKLPSVYLNMRTAIMVPLLGVMVFYYPAYSILSVWLPQYSDSLRYMAVILPICVFESKVSMLINTYLKTLRQEKTILTVNLITLFLSIVLTLITVFYMNDLTLAVFSILFLLAFRSVFAEVLLSKVISINVIRDIVFEVMLTVVFIISSWYVGGYEGLLIYASAYFLYCFLKRKEVRSFVTLIKSLIGTAK